MDSEEFQMRLDKATVAVKELDEIDGYEHREIGTIWQALHCGLRYPDTNAAFDALVMLDDLRRKTQEGGDQ
jgi:hypothetical protein